jgi:hypothetical protein
LSRTESSGFAAGANGSGRAAAPGLTPTISPALMTIRSFAGS